MLSSLVSLVALAASASAQILYAGVSESSGEFGVYSPGNVGFGLPGRFGTDYSFINTVSEVLLRIIKLTLTVGFVSRRWISWWIATRSTSSGSVFS